MTDAKSQDPGQGMLLFRGGAILPGQYMDWGVYDHDPVGMRWTYDSMNAAGPTVEFPGESEARRHWLTDLHQRDADAAQQHAAAALARLTPAQQAEYERISELTGQIRAKRSSRRSRKEPERNYGQTVRRLALLGLADGLTPEQIKATLPTLATFLEQWLADLSVPPSVKRRATLAAQAAARKAAKLSREALGIRPGPARRSVCAQGHSLEDPANVYVRGDGRRMCAVCAKERKQAARSAAKHQPRRRSRKR